MKSHRKKHMRKMIDSRKVFPLICLIPWVIGLIVFTLYPMVQGLIYSFCKTIVKSNGQMILTFVGLDVYKRVLFEDEAFKIRFLIYLKQVGLLTPMIIAFSLLTAVFLNSKIRFRKGFRAIFFLPVILMQGLLYDILKELNVMEVSGLDEFPVFLFITETLPTYISEPLMYMMSNFVLVIWMSGVQILVCLAGLQRTDARIYEAASVDGATAWQCFWKITLPTSKSFIVLCGIYSVLDISISSINPLAGLIKERMIDISTGFGFSAAVTWLYFILIMIFVGITAFLCNGCRIREPKLKTVK